jgi:hypothetical protein
MRRSSHRTKTPASHALIEVSGSVLLAALGDMPMQASYATWRATRMVERLLAGDRLRRRTCNRSLCCRRS